MSQLNSMAIPMEGKYSSSELLELKNKMNAKALAKRRGKTALRLAANIIFAIAYTASAFIRGQHCADAIQ